MSQRLRAAPIFVLLILIAVVLGYYLARRAPMPGSVNKPAPRAASGPLPSQLPPNKPLTRSTHLIQKPNRNDAAPAFAIENEKIARFQNEADYREFLATMASRGLLLRGQSDHMLAVRFGHGEGFDADDMDHLDEVELSYNYLVSIPRPPDVEAQAGAVGFGKNALAWLGVSGDNSDWGKGVTVAVLDSGVFAHSSLDNNHGKISHLTLAELGLDNKQLGHGTAVASIISGDHPLTPGIAPAANILSIRITDAEGISNSFTLANGILAAADAGAEIINISMGSEGHSALVYDAIQYARQKGAVIVASSGNEGLDKVTYPAAYEEVIAVGAVEAEGRHLAFSNSGQSLDITAPGFEVNAAWGEGQLTSFTGTSASAPFISGAIAATLSENRDLTARQAAELVQGLSNDAGYPGSDTAYGSGILAIDRIMEYGTPGIYDAAITSQLLVPATKPSSLPQILVTIQNQGTETLINSPVQITTPTGTRSYNISSLTPGQIHSFPVPIRLPADGSPVPVSSSVQIPESDQEPENNHRSTSFSQR